jgi:hypothetical protein
MPRQFREERPMAEILKRLNYTEVYAFGTLFPSRRYVDGRSVIQCSWRAYLSDEIRSPSELFDGLGCSSGKIVKWTNQIRSMKDDEFAEELPL